MAAKARKLGWYSDPAKPAQFRFWDGRAWTHWVADSTKAPLPDSLDPHPVAPIRDWVDQLVSVIKWTAAVVVVALVAATAIGVVLNRRDAATIPPYRFSNSPAPTQPTPPPSIVTVTDRQVRLGGWVSATLPPTWTVEDPFTSTGIFSKVVYTYPADVKSVNGFPEIFAGVGTLDFTLLPETAKEQVGRAAQLTARRFYRDEVGLSVGQPVTVSLDTFGKEHPAISAKVPVTWSGGSTTIELRAVKITDEFWMGWISNDGDGLDPSAKALREQAWSSITFAGS